MKKIFVKPAVELTKMETPVMQATSSLKSSGSLSDATQGGGTVVIGAKAGGMGTIGRASAWAAGKMEF